MNTMELCIFCKVADKKPDTDLLYEDQDIIAFKDIMPKAPVHFLIIPRQHIATLNEVTDFSILVKMNRVAVNLARQHAVSASGYRLLLNCNKHGGQEVPHLHMHLLGGKQLGSIG